MHKHPGHIILSPRITEKASYLSEKGVYSFNVTTSATKREIIAAVQEVYKVTPQQVRIVAIPRKQRMTRGTNRMGISAGGKKAYVYLKEGDKIDVA